MLVQQSSNELGLKYKTFVSKNKDTFVMMSKERDLKNKTKKQPKAFSQQPVIEKVP